jgi:hypothetical protein
MSGGWIVRYLVQIVRTPDAPDKTPMWAERDTLLSFGSPKPQAEIANICISIWDPYATKLQLLYPCKYEPIFLKRYKTRGSGATSAVSSNNLHLR